MGIVRGKGGDEILKFALALVEFWIFKKYAVWYNIAHWKFAIVTYSLFISPKFT